MMNFLKLCILYIMKYFFLCCDVLFDANVYGVCFDVMAYLFT